MPKLNPDNNKYLLFCLLKLYKIKLPKNQAELVIKIADSSTAWFQKNSSLITDKDGHKDGPVVIDKYGRTLYFTYEKGWIIYAKNLLISMNILTKNLN